jgi:hypothetical protein
MPEPDDRFFDTDGNLDVMALWADTVRVVTQAFGPVCWAEEEAEKLTADHPDAADLIFHTLALIRPPEGLPIVERNIRSHTRELLARAVAGDDLRPATAVEICAIASQASLQAPLNDAATGLYARAFSRAFPELDNPMAEDLAYLERNGYLIDDLERDVLRATAARNPGRRLIDGRGKPLPTITCAGRHHDEPVVCRFAVKARVAAPVAGPAPQPAPPPDGTLDNDAQQSLFEIMLAVTGKEARDA